MPSRAPDPEPMRRWTVMLHMERPDDIAPDWLLAKVVDTAQAQGWRVSFTLTRIGTSLVKSWEEAVAAGEIIP